MKSPETVAVRVHGSSGLPTLVYLPGIHGDWTLVSSFRHALQGKVRFVEFTYPRTATWSLEDYAIGIETALQAAQIQGGWLLGESFGSQPAWQMMARSIQGRSEFTWDGLILAGGFVKHPWPWGARFLRCMTQRTPRGILRGLLWLYGCYARFRHRLAPETLSEIRQFVENRLHPDDPTAMMQRYTIVAESDLRAVAASVQAPVFQLRGLVDPIVPGRAVRRWLARSCPGFMESRLISVADHNVLGTAPEKSATATLEWIKGCRERAEPPASVPCQAPEPAEQSTSPSIRHGVVGH